MTDNFGTGVSRTLDPTATEYSEVVFLEGAPLCDADLNLVGQLAEDWQRKLVLRGTPSGWLGNGVNQSKVYLTDPSYSNWFQFGSQRTGDQQSIMWAVVNGWLLPITGTQTGLPPGSANNSDTFNKILLPPPPVSAGSSRADFIFLEVWKALVSPNPSTLNKPSASAIYRFGNLEGGWSYLADDFIDPEIGEATSDRAQIQYRIRVVSGLNNITTYPDGFDPSVVFAQGSQATPPPGGFTFSNMRELLGDNGLWRAGDGNSGNSLGTADGFVYAIPIAIIFRRCSTLWGGDPSPNLNGAFNRNPTAVDRFGATTFSTVPTLASPLTAIATSITLTSIANIPLPASPASAVVIQIGDELLTYASITSTTIAVIRGVQGTVAEAHPAGSIVRVLSSRPDGLFADQITGTDLLDLRHVVSSSGFDYQSLLQSNLDKLLKGQLRTSYKRSGSDPRGSFVFFEDRISQTPPSILGITALDAPDHIRLAFSDAAIQQPVEVIVRPIVSGPTFPLAPPTPPFATPSVTWDLQLPNPVMAIRQKAASIWSSEATTGDGTGDTLQIDVTQFQTPSLPGSDADQVRFLNEVPISSVAGFSYGTYQLTDVTVDFTTSLVYPGDSIVIFTPLIGFPVGGTYPISEVTSTVLTSAVTIPAPVTPGPISYEIRRGVGSVQIRIEGSATSLGQNRFRVTPLNPVPTDSLAIQFVGAGSPFPTSPPSIASQLYITTNIQYGGGRGIARRPDSVHNVVLVNPSATPEVLIQSEYEVSGEYNLSTSWVPLWSKFRNDPYKSLLPVTAGSYVDSGSKTLVLTPFQGIRLPDGYYLSASGLPAGFIMSTTPEGGLLGTLDPLGLFHHTVYVTLPRHLVPGFGGVSVPILPANSTDFSRGINFMLMSKEGLIPDNPDYINYTTLTTTCAIFSTLVSYNTASGAPLRAGMRLFNDDPTVGGALSTARGLGRQGLEIPPYYGISRLFAVYEAGDYAVNGSAFNIATDRTPLISGGAKNLLRQSFDGPVFWIERDAVVGGGVSTFILNADAIDLSKAPIPPSSFAAGDYVIEANVFGFDLGSFDLTQSFRLALSSDVTLSGSPVAGPITVLPGPLPASATALINYSRTPYQGDPWQTASSALDEGYQRGPLSSSDAYLLASTSLAASALTRPNQKSLEVLASIGFITSLGTGRLSGDFVAPNAYDPRNVGYEDPLAPNPYPPPSGAAPRPGIKLGAIGSSPSFTDLEANPEYLGLTTRLPLGALYRDKDFHGGRFSNEQSSPLIYIDKVGAGSGVAGLTATEMLDQAESPTMPAETSAGLPGDIVVLVDGESTNYSSLTNFRTNRGGSAFIGSGDRPGGEIFATYERVLGSVSGSRTLVGRVFLVRNTPTTVGSLQVSAGDELMMVVATQVMELDTTPSEAMILLGTNGSGESISAADLYRIEGHPLIANHTFYDVDPATIQLPVGKTIAQITAPPAVPVIPLGAADTVYASNGTSNFWTNAPTVQSLSTIGNLSVGGSVVGDLNFSDDIVFNYNNSSPQIYQANALVPTFSPPTLAIQAQISPASPTSFVSSSGLTLTSGGVLPAAGPNIYGNTGYTYLQTAILGATLTGDTGSIQVETGNNAGTGNTGVIWLASGVAANGTSGDVNVRTGTATIGTAGNVNLIAGAGSVANGSVNVRFGSGGPTDQHASFTNVNLNLGPVSGSGNYGVHFSAGATNPTIDQDTAAVNGATLTINAQNAGPVSGDNGGGISLITGRGTGTGLTGELIISNGFRNNLKVSATDIQSAFFGHNLTELGDPGTSDIYSLTFSSTVLAPKIGQKETNGNGETLTIKAADVAAAALGNGGQLDLFAGNALGNSGNHKVGGDIYLKAGKGSFGASGQVIVQIETGTTLSPAPATVATFNQAAAIINVNSLAFDPSVSFPTSPVISQQDATAGDNGRNLTVQAQKGDQTAGSTKSGGNLTLTSGARGPAGAPGTNGQIIFNLGNHATQRAAFTETGLGINNTESTGTDSALGLQTSTNDPPTHPSGTDNEIYVNVNGDLKVDAAGRGVSTLNGTVARLVDSSSLLGSNPITSATYINVVGVTSPTFTVVAGDIIEGSAHIHVSQDFPFGGTMYVQIHCTDGTAPEDFEVEIAAISVATDFYIEIPIYYIATVSGTVTITLQSKLGSGSSGIRLYNKVTSSKWLFLKQTRP